MNASPQLAALRACQDRRFDREGIPMYLTLVSEVSPEPVPDGDERARREGSVIAAAMDSYRAGLLPSAPDGDLGALVSVLQAVAHVDLYSPPAPAPPGVPSGPDDLNGPGDLNGPDVLHGPDASTPGVREARA